MNPDQPAESRSNPHAIVAGALCRWSAGVGEIVGKGLVDSTPTARVHLELNTPLQVRKGPRHTGRMSRIGVLHPIPHTAHGGPGQRKVPAGLPRGVKNPESGSGIGGIGMGPILLAIAEAVVIVISLGISDAVRQFPSVRQAVAIGVRRRDDIQVQRGYAAEGLAIARPIGDAVHPAKARAGT